MIWQSITLMTIIDVLIIGSVAYMLGAFYRQRRKFPGSTVSLGFFAIVSGLSLVALFYLFDLTMMHVLPLFVPMSAAMAVMENLHLNYHWVLILLAVVAITTCFGAISRGVFTITDKQHESENLLKLIIDHVPAAISYFDTEQRFQFTNRQTHNLVGKQPSEVIGKTLEEVIGKKPYQVARKYVQRALEGEHVNFENTLPAENGASIPVAVSYVPDFGQDKTVKGFIAQVRDITNRKRSEAALVEMSTLLKKTIESMTQGINVYDADLKLVAFNQNFVDFNGFPPGSIRTGMGFEDVVRLRAKQGFYGPVDDIDTLVRERIANRNPADLIRHERTLADGRVIAVSRDPMPDGGIVQTFTDITERKQAEEKIAEKSALLDTTFENMSQGISVYDADLKLVAFNQQIINLMDFPPGFLRLGMPYEEIARFKAERGDYGPGDVDELVRKHVLHRRERKPNRKERTWPNGKVTLMRRDVLPDGGYVSTHTDITERMRAEEKIAEKSELLDTTFESMSQGIAMYDADYKLVGFNEKFSKIFGFPRGFLHEGMSIDEIVRQRHKQGHYEESVEDVVSRRQTSLAMPELSGERTLPNGTVVAYHREAMPGGGCVTTHTDITERKRAEEALQKANDVLESKVRERTRKLRDTNRKLRSEIADRKRGEEELAGKSELLMTTFDNMSQGIRVLDKELKVVAFNQKYIDLMAFPPGVVRVGIPLEELARFKAERGDHGSVDVEEFVNNRMLVRRRGKSEIYQYDDLPNGLTVLCHHNSMPDGGSVATYTDITEGGRMATALEEALEQHRRLLESTNAIPWEADAKTWEFTYIGPQVVELLGYPRELWLGKDFWVEHIHPEDCDWVVDYCQSSATQQEHYDIEYRMIAADGRVIWLQDIVNVVKQEGKPVILRGFMIDITERRSLEALRQNVSSWLIRAQEEERRKIARELHDDFGQRLALLAVEIQQLGQKKSKPVREVTKTLDKLWSQTQKLSTDLHRLSHQLHPAILDQLGLVAAIRSLCNEISEQYGIQIQFIEHGVPASISRDIALCFYRTVQEGLRNIVKHSGAKDAKIELTGGLGTIHLQIADEGVGFDPKTIKGNGLGLVSIEERIRLVNGEMSLQSRPAHGTCIDLRIPSAALDA